MVLEFMVTELILKKWKENPKATKKEIGVWYHWQLDTPENNLSLSKEEVKRMQQLLLLNKKHGNIRTIY